MRRLGFLVALALLAAAPAEAEPFKIIVTETETPLVPNSVEDLAIGLGYYKKAGADVELVRVQQTPSAVAALRSGQGDMANIGTDTALQLLGRGQMALKAVVSPDKALPFLIVGKSSLAKIADLNGKVFGVGRVGSVDDLLSQIVLTKLGVDASSLQYLAIGQPAVRAEALVAGRIDATAISIGAWTALPDKSSTKVLVEEDAFYRLAPLVSKLNVVTDSVVAAKAKDIAAVVRGIILASRDFAAKPALWVDAMAAARPDVDHQTLETLAAAYRKSWSVNGGLDPVALSFTTDTMLKSPDFADAKRVDPAQWVDTSFIDATLKEIGRDKTLDPVPP